MKPARILSRENTLITGGQTIMDKSNYFSIDNIRDHIQRRDYGIAIKKLDELIKVNPNNIEALNLLGYCKKCTLQSDKDLDNLIMFLEDVKKIDENNVMTHFNLATAYFDKGDFTKALELFDAADKLFPNNGKILFNIGLCYEKLSHIDNAQLYYEKASEHDPKFKKPLINAALIYDKHNQKEKLDKITNALEANFAYDPKSLNLINVMIKDDPLKFAEIESNFSKITRIDSKNIVALYNNGVFCFHNESYQMAADLFHQVLELIPESKSNHPIKIFCELSLATTYEKLNILKEARKYYIKASDDIGNSMDKKDLEDKIEELHKKVQRVKGAQRPSLQAFDNDLIGIKNFVNLQGEYPNVDINQSNITDISGEDSNDNSNNKPNESNVDGIPENVNDSNPKQENNLIIDSQKTIDNEDNIIIKTSDPDKKYLPVYDVIHEEKNESGLLTSITHIHDLPSNTNMNIMNNKSLIQNDEMHQLMDFNTPIQELDYEKSVKDIDDLGLNQNNHIINDKENMNLNDSQNKKDNKQDNNEEIQIIQDQKREEHDDNVEDKIINIDDNRVSEYEPLSPERRSLQSLNKTGEKSPNNRSFGNSSPGYSLEVHDNIQGQTFEKPLVLALQTNDVETKEEEMKVITEINKLSSSIDEKQKDILKPEPVQDKSISDENKNPEKPLEKAQRKPQKNLSSKFKDVPIIREPGKEPQSSKLESKSSDMQNIKIPLDINHQPNNNSSSNTNSNDSNSNKGKYASDTPKSAFYKQSHENSHDVSIMEGKLNHSVYDSTPNNKEKSGVTKIFDHSSIRNATQSNIDITPKLDREFSKELKSEINREEDKGAIISLLANDPNDHLANLRLAEIMLQEADIIAAYKYFSKAKELKPDEELERVNIGLAKVYMHKGEYETSLSYLNILENKFPIQPNVLIYKAKCLRKLNQYDEYKQYTNKAYELFPNFPMVIIEYGWLQYREGDTKNALNYLKRAYELDSDQLKINLKLGKLYSTMENEIENATYFLEQAIKIDKENYQALVRLAKIHEKKGEYDIALKLLIAAAPSPKMDVNYHLLLV